MIKNLLAYQELDKKAIQLRYMVEGGKVKREIDSATKMVSDAKGQITQLEEDAKGLTHTYESLSKALKSLLKESETLANGKLPTSEDKIAEVDAKVKEMSNQINILGNQLENVGKSIAARVKAFNDAVNTAGKGQQIVKTLMPQYESQKAQIKPKLDEVEKEMAKLVPSIDKVALAKYIARRKNEPMGKPTDIVVALANGRCGGCLVEMPQLVSHKIATDGYVICEECGKILYKA